MQSHGKDTDLNRKDAVLKVKKVRAPLNLPKGSPTQPPRGEEKCRVQSDECRVMSAEL